MKSLYARCSCRADTPVRPKLAVPINSTCANQRKIDKAESGPYAQTKRKFKALFLRPGARDPVTSLVELSPLRMRK
jgi:hypothetical protein